MDKIEDITGHVSAVARMIERKVSDDVDGAKTAAEMATLLYQLKALSDALKKVSADVNKAIASLAYAKLPEAMEDDGVHGMTMDGFSVHLSQQYSVKSGYDQTVLHKWLRDHGYGDAVRDAVHPSALKAVLKECVEVVGVLPPVDFEVSQVARIRKK